MAKLKTLEDFLIEELKDLYSAEKQMTKALPKMQSNGRTCGRMKGNNRGRYGRYSKRCCAYSCRTKG